MDIVNVFRGGVAVRLPMDGYTPDVEPPLQTFIQAIGERYQFAGWPTPQTPLPPANTTFIFQNGSFNFNGSLARVHTLHIEPVGAYLDSTNTEIAESAIYDLARFLDAELGYKFSAVTGKFSFNSVVVVKFRASLDNILGPSRELLKIVSESANSAISSTFRKIDFISRDLPLITPATQVDNAESTVFSLERRVGFRNDENVYFSIAPMRTEHHIEALQKIEGLL